MQPTHSSSQWKQWLRPSRLIPLLTILGAGIAITLSLLRIMVLSVAEEVIIALLALLAVDALSERINVLERIEAQLRSLSTAQPLRTRADISSIVEHAERASEICFLAVHGTSVIIPNMGFLRNKIQNGCNIRVILLDPNTPSLKTWNLLVPLEHPQTKRFIMSSLENLRELMLLPEAKGKCEVRLSNVFIPFSMYATDPTTKSGSMNIEYHSYKAPIDDCPHVHLTASDNPYWFDHYKRQFEQVWSDAIAWPL